MVLYSFRVGFSDSRPVRPDEHVHEVSLLGEDSVQGFRESRQLVVSWIQLGRCGGSMVTSVELLGVEV